MYHYLHVVPYVACRAFTQSDHHAPYPHYTHPPGARIKLAVTVCPSIHEQQLENRWTDFN